MSPKGDVVVCVNLREKVGALVHGRTQRGSELAELGHVLKVGQQVADAKSGAESRAEWDSAASNESLGARKPPFLRVERKAMSMAVRVKNKQVYRKVSTKKEYSCEGMGTITIVRYRSQGTNSGPVKAASQRAGHSIMREKFTTDEDSVVGPTNTLRCRKR